MVVFFALNLRIKIRRVTIFYCFRRYFRCFSFRGRIILKERVVEKVVEKGICFRLGSERYVHPISTVKEVLSYQSPAPVPGACEGVEGMIDVRGNMVTVLYGTPLLNLDPAECEEEGHIIVLDLPTGYFGIRVEAVERVMDLPEKMIPMDWSIETMTVFRALSSMITIFIS
jgi:hypothetical protein